MAGRRMAALAAPYRGPGAVRACGLAAAVLAVAASGALPTQAQEALPAAEAVHWVGTWSAAAQPPLLEGVALSPGFRNQTLREIVHASIGGNRVRVRFTNAYGAKALRIGAAHVALQQAGPATVAGTRRVLSFGGAPGVTIAPGAMVLSDPVSLALPAQANLAVSMYLPEATGLPTLLFRARQTSYASTPGNHSAAARMPVLTTEVCTTYLGQPACSSPWYFLAGVDVVAPSAVSAIVALGDSLTAGACSPIDANQRWPDVLARRLLRNGMPLGVLNQGLGGNALGEVGVGESALKRFDDAVLTAPGARYLIVLMGINDLRAGVPAAQVIAGLQQIAGQARTAGLQVFGGTLTPYWQGRKALQRDRQAVNAWIRSSSLFDAVIDFDAAVRDPSQPERLRPDFDCGDTLHLNAAGYAAMARAIDLKLFRR